MNDQHVPPGPGAGGTTPALPPAGWYADPADAHQLRFWDGRVWTERVSQPSSHAPAPVAVLRSTSSRRGGFGCTAFVGATLIVIAIIVGVLVVGARLSGSGGEGTAVAACRLAVVTRLQAPDSAVFSSVEASEGAPDHWTVTGAVDSRTAVGTSQRTTFTCVVSPDPDGQWHLDSLHFKGP
jgi:Protein of unknown function (DUF2510)